MRRCLPVIGILVVLSLFSSVSRAEALPFTVVGEGWDGPGRGRADLTFYFGTPTLDFPRDLQHAALITALDAWASVAAVTFTETFLPDQPRSIDFNFGTSVETDFLAFAFFPEGGGDVYFNDNFPWEFGDVLGSAAFDMERVAVHEIGHALGLDHSTTQNAVMWPFTSSSDVFVRLHPDDVAGINSLYAAVAVPEPSTLLLASVGLIAFAVTRRGHFPRRRELGHRPFSFE